MGRLWCWWSIPPAVTGRPPQKVSSVKSVGNKGSTAGSHPGLCEPRCAQQKVGLANGFRVYPKPCMLRRALALT